MSSQTRFTFLDKTLFFYLIGTFSLLLASPNGNCQESLQSNADISSSPIAEEKSIEIPLSGTASVNAIAPESNLSPRSAESRIENTHASKDTYLSGPHDPDSKISPLAGVQAHYQEGKYRHALDILAGMPVSDTTHYYSGLCYQGQGQLQRARNHFAWVAYYSKDPRMKNRAQQAISSIDNYASNRTYQGQGNNFSRRSYSSPGVAASSGGAPVRRG